MPVEPYPFFEGRCEEVVELCGRALGAEVIMLMRYKDSPEPAPAGKLPAGSENKVMHAGRGNLRGVINVRVSSGRPRGLVIRGPAGGRQVSEALSRRAPMAAKCVALANELETRVEKARATLERLSQADWTR